MDKTVFVFSGQGSQYPGMCRKLYESDPEVREYFERAKKILGYDISEVCFGEQTELLNKTEFAQPAIFMASVSQLVSFRKSCIRMPDAAAGHSIGEYAALYCAGVLTFEETLGLVKKRAEFMDAEAANQSGCMYAVRGITTQETEKIVEETRKYGIVCVSNYNGLNNVVISGEEDAVIKAAETVISRGGQVFKLNVSSGFHSMLMRNAAEKFENILSSAHFSEPKIPVISNITGTPYKDSEDIRQSLASQIVSPVKWYQSVMYMQSIGCTEAFEFGPKKVLKNFINKDSSIEAFSFDNEYDVIQITSMFNKQKMNSMIYGLFLREAVTHKCHHTDSSGYSENVVKPYREIEKIYLSIKNEGHILTSDELRLSEEMLRKILTYKNTSGAERICEEIYTSVKSKLFC